MSAHEALVFITPDGKNIAIDFTELAACFDTDTTEEGEQVFCRLSLEAAPIRLAVADAALLPVDENAPVLVSAPYYLGNQYSSDQSDVATDAFFATPYPEINGAIAAQLQMDRIIVAPEIIEGMRDDVLPDSFREGIGIYFEETFSGIQNLYENHPVLFWGGLALIGGTMFFLMGPMAFPVLFATGTKMAVASTLIKGSVILAGTTIAVNEAHHLYELSQQDPSTLIGEYTVVKEKITSTVNLATVVVGTGVASTELLGPQIMSRGGVLVYPFVYGHLDELAVLSGSVSSSVHYISDETPYFFQWDEGLQQIVYSEALPLDESVSQIQPILTIQEPGP